MKTVKFKYLVKEISLHSNSMNENKELIKKTVTNALIKAVNDFELEPTKEVKVQTTENTFEIITNIIKHTTLTNDRKADLIERAINNYQSLVRDADRKIISSFLSPL